MENKLFSSLSSFQKECPVIHKGTQGYGYSYADLPAIFEVINPILDRHNLGFTQPICGSKVKTILYHTVTGETLESETDIPQGVQLKGMNDFQILGSAITYIRRYALSSMLGIITDKDNDGVGEQQKQTPQQTPQPQAKPPTQTLSLPWLNPNTPEWNTVLDILKNGYEAKDGTHKDCTIDDVKKKYKITKANQDKLIEQTLV